MSAAITKRSPKERSHARSKRHVATVSLYRKSTGLLVQKVRIETTIPTIKQVAESLVHSTFYNGFTAVLSYCGGSMVLPEYREPVGEGPGHWLGCSLPLDHEGDCSVPRARR